MTRTLRTTIADRLISQGQTLRANESVTKLTINLGYTAKWMQATQAKE